MADFALKRRSSMPVRTLMTAGVAFAFLALSGCSDRDTRATIDQQAVVATQGVEAAAHPSIPAKRYNPLVVTDKVWAGSTAIRMHRGQPLPARYESSHGVTLVASDPMALTDITNAISQQTGIPIYAADSGTAHSAQPQQGGQAGPAAQTMSIAYEGPLSGLLERVASTFGVSWNYDGSTIAIRKFQTHVFIVEALPGTQQVQEGMQDDSSSSSSGSSGGSSGGGGSSSQNTITQNSKFSLDIKYWDELNQILTSMLGGVGTVVVSPSIGTVTISTTPDIMHMIADYLSQENQRLSRQIGITVEIYTVSLSSGMDFAVTFNALLRKLTTFAASTGAATAPASISGFSGFTGGGTLGLSIIDPRNVGTITDVFTALSGIADTTKVAKFPLVTLNNRPVSRRIGKDIGYVASATSGSNTGSGSTTLTSSGATLTPGTLHQGFSVQLTPRLLDDGRILLQYSLSIVDVLAIQSFNSVCGTAGSTCTTASSAQGSSTVQLPTTSNRIFVQQSVLKSGSTLIIGGADEQDASQSSQGVGDPSNYFLGGGNSTNKTRDMVFFVLTPQVLDVARTEKD